MRGDGGGAGEVFPEQEGEVVGVLCVGAFDEGDFGQRVLDGGLVELESVGACGHQTNLRCPKNWGAWKLSFSPMGDHAPQWGCELLSAHL